MDKQKDTFILPEKWFIKTTNDNEDRIVVKYINETFNKKIDAGLGSMNNRYFFFKCWYYSNTPIPYLSGISDKYDYGVAGLFLEHGFEEITFQQFLDYVLNNINHQENIEEYNKILINLLTNE